jgi:hypothetical protein
MIYYYITETIVFLSQFRNFVSKTFVCDGYLSKYKEAQFVTDVSGDLSF